MSYDKINRLVFTVLNSRSGPAFPFFSFLFYVQNSQCHHSIGIELTQCERSRMGHGLVYIVIASAAILGDPYGNCLPSMHIANGSDVLFTGPTGEAATANITILDPRFLSWLEW